MSTQSSITQQELSTDVLESPVYQNYEVCLQRYLTWLPSHEIGLALTVESSLLDAAARIHQRPDHQVNYSPYEFPLEHYAQLQQQLVEMTIFCRRFASYVDERRWRTFDEFSASTGLPVSLIEEAWDLRCSSAEDITYTITKMGWENIEEARWRDELAWRLGHTSIRPRLLFLMPRRQVVINDTLRQLTVTTSASTSASTTSASTTLSSSSSSPLSQSTTTNSPDLGALPDRTTKPSPS